MFNSHVLSNISPIDGRYHTKTAALQTIFSESGLMHQRLRVEVDWLLYMAAHDDFIEIPAFSEQTVQQLHALVDTFTVSAAEQVKAIEQHTNHDVKAIEYYIKQAMAENAEVNAVKEFIHFACTSEDINNLAYALMLKQAHELFLQTAATPIIKQLQQMAHQYADVAMLARTHGQAATPTTVGKEIANFMVRLQHTVKQIEAVKIRGKFNGAVGNLNAHLSAYPNIDWLDHSRQFVKQLDLDWNAYTTQIEPHDYIAELCHAMLRFNTILIDLARDFWGYISLAYFKQAVVKGEVGSSTMPHKVNPIDFENAEGNLKLANCLFDFFARELPISRWQRDLTDSTILRNLGMAFAHSFISYQSLQKGIGKIAIDQEKIAADLQSAWQILAEPLQTVMRRYGIDQAYEQLKQLTRGQDINKQILQQFIQSLALSDNVKQQLLALTPDNYIGLAAQLAKEV